MSGRCKVMLGLLRPAMPPAQQSDAVADVKLTAACEGFCCLLQAKRAVGDSKAIAGSGPGIETMSGQCTSGLNAVCKKYVLRTMLSWLDVSSWHGVSRLKSCMSAYEDHTAQLAGVAPQAFHALVLVTLLYACMQTRPPPKPKPYTQPSPRSSGLWGSRWALPPTQESHNEGRHDGDRQQSAHHHGCYRDAGQTIVPPACRHGFRRPRSDVVWSNGLSCSGRCWHYQDSSLSSALPP